MGGAVHVPAIGMMPRCVKEGDSADSESEIRNLLLRALKIAPTVPQSNGNSDVVSQLRNLKAICSDEERFDAAGLVQQVGPIPHATGRPPSQASPLRGWPCNQPYVASLALSPEGM